MRSTSARGFSSSPSITGTVDGITRRWATKCPGAARIAAASFSNPSLSRCAPNTASPGIDGVPGVGAISAPAAPVGYAGFTTISPRWASTCDRISGCPHHQVSTEPSRSSSPSSARQSDGRNGVSAGV